MTEVGRVPGTVAITGVDGFVGHHVAALAASEGYNVIGLARAPSPEPELAQHLAGYYPVDLRAQWPLRRSVDAVIHLAGLAAVGPSFREPQNYIEWNSAIVTTMCEAILAGGYDNSVRVVGVTTGAVYAPGSRGAALHEGSAIAASSPYVVSKLLVEHQFDYYARRGLDAVVVRPFNHIGPGQASGFLLPDLVAKLRSHRHGEPMRTGNLSTERDYTDVRDVARAYLLLAVAPGHDDFVYNVASGRSLSGTEILRLASKAIGVPTPTTETDPNLLRATDADRVVGSAQRLQAEFGWTPRISVEESIADYVAGSQA